MLFSVATVLKQILACAASLSQQVRQLGKAGKSAIFKDARGQGHCLRSSAGNVENLAAERIAEQIAQKVTLSDSLGNPGSVRVRRLAGLPRHNDYVCGQCARISVRPSPN